jgi:hypothetical protein
VYNPLFSENIMYKKKIVVGGGVRVGSVDIVDGDQVVEFPGSL